MYLRFIPVYIAASHAALSEALWHMWVNFSLCLCYIHFKKWECIYPDEMDCWIKVLHLVDDIR